MPPRQFGFFNPKSIQAVLVNRAEDYRYGSAIYYAEGKSLLKVEVV